MIYCYLIKYSPFQDESGYISSKEIGNMLRILGFNFSDKDVREVALERWLAIDKMSRRSLYVIVI